jgi:hypothetical protein
VTYLRLTRIGNDDDSRDALLLGLVTPASVTHTFTGLIVDAGCGRVKVANSMPNAVGLDVTNCTFKELTGTNFTMSGSGGSPSATRRVRGCVFLGPVLFSQTGMTIGGSSAGDENLFLGAQPSFDNTVKGTLERFVIRQVSVSGGYRGGDWSEFFMFCDGSDYDGNGRYTTKDSLANVHWTDISTGPASTYIVEDGVVESFGMNSSSDIDDNADGDWDYGPVANKITALARVIMVPQDRDSTSVPTSPATMSTNMAGVGSTYDHCTHYIGGQAFIALDESTWNDPSNYNAGGVFNAVCTTTNPGFLVDMEAMPEDVIADGAATHNLRFNLAESTANYSGVGGYHYNRSAGADPPGTNDLVQVDPQFVNHTVRFWRWVKGLIGSNVIPAPASGGSTLTVVDDTKMGGATAGNPSPPATGWRDYCAWGIYKLSLKNETAHADYDAAYTLGAYLSYIRAGFAPRNEALRNAGHDAVTIGAVEWVDTPNAQHLVAHSQPYLFTWTPVPY